MNNKDIATKFNQLAKIMELHGENPFRIKSYSKAYKALRNIDISLADATPEELSKIDGVGKSTIEKIGEIMATGEIKSFLKYKEKTPQGIIDLLTIRGIGVKKIGQIWKETGATSAEEIMEKVDNGTLLFLKGFGDKNIADLKQKLAFFLQWKGYKHYASLEEIGEHLLSKLRSDFPSEQFDFCGAFGRKNNVVKHIEILTTLPVAQLEQYQQDDVKFVFAEKESYGTKLLQHTSSEAFQEGLTLKNYSTITSLWKDNGWQPIPPEYRESALALEQSKEGKLPVLIEDKDIKGIVHNHSTYSDGIHTLREMCDYVHENGYEYFVISDHSKAAFFANGLNEQRAEQQWEEIDSINNTFEHFHTFKGIECDILSDGSMDFEDDFLKEFEVVVASVHIGLEMDSKKATHRLAKAIENPHVHILGHCSGRLLLERKGYDFDYPYIIDACAANGVAIELNANPKRLDMDWTWLPYALEKGIMISINPDAHSRQGIHNVKYGVISARKGGLTADMCLNSLSKDEFQSWINLK